MVDIYKIFQDALKVIGFELINRTRIRTRNEQVSPDGTPLKPLSKGYLAAKQKKGKGSSILTYDGSLLGKMRAIPEGLKLKIAPTVDYAAKHQLGLKGLPKRPFLDTKNEDPKEKEIIDRRLTEAFNKAVDEMFKEITGGL